MNGFECIQNGFPIKCQILQEVLHIPVESGLALMKIELHVKLSNLILNTAYNRSPHSIPG